MLRNVQGKTMTRVPHGHDFDAVLSLLGDHHVAEVRAYLNRVIDERAPDKDRGRRSFSSSHLGSDLSPWPDPLKYLYDVAREIEGANADEEAVQRRAGLIFGLFMWDCMLRRPEEWVVYDPNLSARDPNREITGKVYFEQ